jgi:hypothetical protein
MRDEVKRLALAAVLGAPPLSSLRQKTGELVQIPVRPANVNPFPAAVVLSRAHELNAGSLELAARRVDVIDLEEWDGPIRLLAEELEVRVSRRHDLDLVPLRGRELNRRRFLEIDAQAEDVPEEADHRLVAVGANTDPADVTHFHSSPV